MKQHEAVIITLEKLGGQATLADIYREAMKVGNENSLRIHSSNRSATTRDLQSSTRLMGIEVLSEEPWTC